MKGERPVKISFWSIDFKVKKIWHPTLGENLLPEAMKILFFIQNQVLSIWLQAFIPYVKCMIPGL